MEQLSFFLFSKFKLSEVNLGKCVKSESEQADGAIFDSSVGIILLHYCTTGWVSRRVGLSPAYSHSCGSRTPLIKRTIPCWVIGSLGLL